MLGDVYIVAAPSGGGKTSLVKELVNNLDEIEVSVSHTTRPPRPGEKEGVDYFFINEQQFLSMINNNGFIEHAKVFDHYYGTSIAQINDRVNSGIDVVLDIDWQGAQQVRRLFPSAISVFILPPSLSVLKKRLVGRKQDDTQRISRRMQQAQEELSHYVEFNYLIVNDDFSEAAKELQTIVCAKRLTLERQSNKVGKLLSILLAAQ